MTTTTTTTMSDNTAATNSTSTTAAVPPPLPFEVTVARKLEALSYSLLDTFLKLDVDRDGYVTRSDYQTALHNVLGIDLTEDQLDAIFYRFGHFESNEERRVDGIRYQEFVQYMEATAKSRLSMVAAPSTNIAPTLLEAAAAQQHNDSLAVSKSVMLPVVISHDQEVSQNRQELLRLLRAHSSASNGGMQVTHLFLEMDTHRSGSVSTEEFCTWVNHHIGKELLTLEILKDIMGKDHFKEKGWNYNEFVAAILALQKEDMALGLQEETWGEEQHAVAPLVVQTAKEHYHEAVKDTADNYKSDVEIAKVIANQLFQKRTKLVDAFNKYDLDGSGRLTGEELCRALNQAGLHVSVERAQSLVTKFDLDGDGRLNKSEFVRWIATSSNDENEDDTTTTDKPPSDASPSCSKTDAMRRSLVASVVGHAEKEQLANRFDKDDLELLLNFREALEAEKVLTRKMFTNMDKDGNKLLSVEELQEGFEQMGVTISREHVQHIMNRFETEGTGNLKYYQFVKLISANLDHALDA